MNAIQKRFFDLHVKQFTGKVTLKKDAVTKTIFFKKGSPIFVESDVRSETLVQMLFEKGKITTEQYSKILETMQTSHKRQGEVIVELGIMSAFEVFQALQDQLEIKVQNALILEGAVFEVEAGDAHLEGIPEFSVNFFRSIVDMLEITERTRESVKLSEDRWILLNKGGQTYLKSQSLTSNETRLLRLLDGKKPFSAIIETAGGDPEANAFFLTALRGMGFVDLVEPQAKVAPPASALREARQVVTIQEPKPAAEPSAKANPIFTWALRLERPLQEFLGVTPNMNRIQVKKRYEAVVRELHLNTIDEVYKEAREKELAERVFSRLTLAVTVLSDDKRRHDYLKSLSQKGEQKDSTPAIKAEVHAQKAKLLLANKKFTAAEEELKKATELMPEESSYLVDLAEVLIQKTNTEKGTFPPTIDQYLRKAVGLNSSDYRAYLNLGLLSKLQKDYEKARGYFSKVIEINPKNSQAHSELRLVNQRIGKGKGPESSFLKFFSKKKKE